MLTFWRHGPKGRKLAAQKVGEYKYNELVFLCHGTQRHEIRCALSNLSRRILKIFP